MPDLDPARERELLRRRVEIWRQTDSELEAIRRRDVQSVTIQEAIHQLFDGMDHIFAAPAPTTSGLIEQQMWFSRIREAAPTHSIDPPTEK